MTTCRPPAPALIAGIALLAGCAQLEWHKSGADAAETGRDSAECAARARTVSLQRGLWIQTPWPRLIHDSRGRVILIQQPWHDDGRFLVEQEALRACMRQRGYALQPPTPTAP